MKKEAFKVFNDEALGRIFMPDGLSYEEYPAECISPFHGRAVALKIAEHQWISVKGGGWNYGGPHIYSSKKDAELIFGLYPLSSAERELEVSRKIEEVSDCFPRVLYPVTTGDAAVNYGTWTSPSYIAKYSTPTDGNKTGDLYMMVK